MSGIYLLLGISDGPEVESKTDPPHTTVLRTKETFGKDDADRVWRGVAAGQLAGETLTLDRVITNTFFHEGLGQDRTDLLWCFDDASAARLFLEMQLVMEAVRFETKYMVEARRYRKNEVPFHITLRTDVSAEDAVERQLEGSVFVRGGYID